MSMDTKSRELFEEWAVPNGYPIKKHGGHVPGMPYWYPQTKDAWEGFQARAAQDNAALAEVRTALDVGADDLDNPPDYVSLRDAVTRAIATLDKLMGEA